MPTHCGVDAVRALLGGVEPALLGEPEASQMGRGRGTQVNKVRPRVATRPACSLVRLHGARQHVEGRHACPPETAEWHTEEYVRLGPQRGARAAKPTLDNAAHLLGWCGFVREQAVVMYDLKTKQVTVVHSNEDGSYWRKIVRNKMVRMQEVRRVKAATEFAREIFQVPEDQQPEVVSSWGPYMSTVGTAKKTGVAGLTAPAAR